MALVTDFCNHKTSLFILVFITVILAVVLHKVRMKLPYSVV